MNKQPHCIHCATPLVRSVEIGLCANCCDRLPKEVERLNAVVEKMNDALRDCVRTGKVGWLQETAVIERLYAPVGEPSANKKD